VPRRKNDKWVYDENSWKISVSSVSPNLSEAGQHITNLSPVEHDIFMAYIIEKGYNIGKSRFRMVSQTRDLRENEKWAQKKPADKDEPRRIEIILHKGISNTYQLRDEMNIIYFLDLQNSMPDYPWAYKKGGIDELF